MAARSLAALLLLAACTREPAPAAAAADALTDAAPAPPPVPPPRAACEGPGCLPAFRLPTLAGDSIASDDLAGKVSLVMFWASWCEPCISEGPGIDAVYRRHRDGGFVLVGLSRDTADDAALRAFRDRHGITYPIARATDEVFKAFGAPAEIPTLILYGKDGRLRWRGTGALPAAVLEGAVTQALAAVPTGQASRTLSIVAVRRLHDPARLAGLLGARRRAGPTIAVLLGETIGARTSPRVLNALRFDAWVTSGRPAGIAAPTVGDNGRAYAIAQAAGLRVAVVKPGMGSEAAARQARAAGQANLLVTIGLPSGDVDLLPIGPPVEAIELSLDDKGQIVSSERRAVDLASVEPDPTIVRLSNL